MRRRPDVTESSPVDLETEVRFLRNPLSYPESTRTVTAVETHMSWVFLTDHFAYKLKKPVCFPFLDYSTIERRRHFCEEEVRLNRRLAPKVYIGTVPLIVTAAGALSLESAGRAIDWLVKMHRLAAERLLDQAIRDGTVTADAVERVAARLAAFYRAAEPVEISAIDYRQRYEADVAANLSELRKFDTLLPIDRIKRVHAAQSAFLRDDIQLLDRRVAERRIVEAHGDLRPEHVMLGPDPKIIDCLEFERAFRLLDPADELSFLAIECEMLGAAAIGDAILDTYRRQTGDDPPARLIWFYKCYRACLRAKIAIWHLREPQPRTPERWPVVAGRYLDLADHYSAKLTAPR